MYSLIFFLFGEFNILQVKGDLRDVGGALGLLLGHCVADENSGT